MVKRILVVGGGSAGFITALGIKTKLPDLQVTVLRSPQIGIIGVGEGTTTPFLNYLHGDLNISPGEFLRTARPTYKLGIKFFWGPRHSFNYTFRSQYLGRFVGLAHDNGFYCDETTDYAGLDSGLMDHNKIFERQENGDLPVVRLNHAYHIENAHFVKFLEMQAAKLGVVITDDTVETVEQNDAGVSGLLCTSGRKFEADLYIDCSGFWSVLLGKTLKEPFNSFSKSLFCDRAVVGGWNRGSDERIQPYTVAETMNAGWCWRIDHLDRINRGYVYSSAFISDEEAEREFRQKNPKVSDARIVKFITGAYARSWVKNVVAIGNSGGFVEPLEATSISLICSQARSLAMSLEDCRQQPISLMAGVYNRWLNGRWNSIRNFLAVHYKFNTRLDTPFWRACINDVDIGESQEFVNFYRECGPNGYWARTVIDGEQVDKTEGHLSMLVGMKVPYRNRYIPSPSDREVWEKKRRCAREKAINGLSMEEALAILCRPECVWPKDFYPPIP